MTHRELCESGAKWLTKCTHWNFRCQRVLVEFCSTSWENPDIFGFRGGAKSICIEVKVSRSDFKKDSQKRGRTLSKGIGATRYYLVPDNLIKPEEILNGWGLIYCDGKDFKVVKDSEYFGDRDFESEIMLMESVIRRLAGNKKVLDFRTKINVI